MELNASDMKQQLSPPSDKPTPIPRTMPEATAKYSREFMEHALSMLVLQRYIEAFHPERNQ